MKKILIIITIILPLVYLISCQDNTIKQLNEPVIEFFSKTDSVKQVSGLLESTAAINNISEHQVTIKLRTEIISLAPNHSVLVCMGSYCFPYSYVGKMYEGEIVLNPQQISDKTHFFSNLNSGGEPGISIIKYIFIPDGDTTKAISYTTKFIVSSDF